MKACLSGMENRNDEEEGTTGNQFKWILASEMEQMNKALM